MNDPWTEPDARPVVNAMDLIAAEAGIVATSREVRDALCDIRVLLLEGLDRTPTAHNETERDYLREIAKVLSRPTIARFTRGT